MHCRSVSAMYKKHCRALLVMQGTEGFLNEIFQINNVTCGAFPWPQMRVHVVTNYLNIDMLVH